MNIRTQYLHLKTDQNGVARLFLQRKEKHNALNIAMVCELTQLLEEIQQSRNIRVLLFIAEGKTFCSGADLADMYAKSQMTEADNQAHAMKIANLMRTLYRLNKPSIAVVHGAAFGAGLGLIACCDIALAADKDIVFCFSEIKFHLTPAVISPYIIAAIGERRAQYYFMTAREFKSEEAMRIGLIHKILPKNKLGNEATLLAEQLAQSSSEAFAEIKTLIRQYHPISDDLVTYTADCLAKGGMSRGAKHTLSAFKKHPTGKASSSETS